MPYLSLSDDTLGQRDYYVDYYKIESPLSPKYYYGKGMYKIKKRLSFTNKEDVILGIFTFPRVDQIENIFISVNDYSKIVTVNNSIIIIIYKN